MNENYTETRTCEGSKGTPSDICGFEKIKHLRKTKASQQSKKCKKSKAGSNQCGRLKKNF